MPFKKHPHDPFPDSFGAWGTAIGWTIVIAGYLWVINEFVGVAS